MYLFEQYFYPYFFQYPLKESAFAEWQNTFSVVLGALIAAFFLFVHTWWTERRVRRSEYLKLYLILEHVITSCNIIKTIRALMDSFRSEKYKINLRKYCIDNNLENDIVAMLTTYNFHLKKDDASNIENVKKVISFYENIQSVFSFDDSNFFRVGIEIKIHLSYMTLVNNELLNKISEIKILVSNFEDEINLNENFIVLFCKANQLSSLANETKTLVKRHIGKREIKKLNEILYLPSIIYEGRPVSPASYKNVSSASL